VGAGAYAWHHSVGLIRRLRRESLETEKIFDRSFSILKKDIDAHITRLKTVKDKRKLTKEEILFLEDFEKNLTDAGDIISKKIKNISDK
jgi:hypothetical protein